MDQVPQASTVKFATNDYEFFCNVDLKKAYRCEFRPRIITSSLGHIYCSMIRSLLNELSIYEKDLEVEPLSEAEETKTAPSSSLNKDPPKKPYEDALRTYKHMVSFLGIKMAIGVSPEFSHLEIDLVGRLEMKSLDTFQRPGQCIRLPAGKIPEQSPAVEVRRLRGLIGENVAKIHRAEVAYEQHMQRLTQEERKRRVNTPALDEGFKYVIAEATMDTTRISVMKKMIQLEKDLAYYAVKFCVEKYAHLKEECSGEIFNVAEFLEKRIFQVIVIVPTASSDAERSRIVEGMHQDMLEWKLALFPMLNQAYCSGLLYLLEVDKQSQRLEKMSERIGRLEIDVKSLDQKVDALDQKVDALDQKVDALDQKVDAMDQKVDSLKADMDQKFDSLKADMDQRFDSLQKTLEGAASALSGRSKSKCCLM